MIDKIIEPNLIKDYLLAQGWAIVEAAWKDGLFVLNHPEKKAPQIRIPRTTDFFDDYEDAQALALNRISAFEKLPLHLLIQKLEAIGDDTLNFRYLNPKGFTLDDLSFNSVFSSLEGVRELILSAASSVLKPAVNFKGRRFSEADEALQKARFRHTQEGSFIIRVSLPLEKSDKSGDFFNSSHALPFTRKMSMLVLEATDKIVSAIENDTEQELIKEIKNAEQPLISSNFCEALIKMFETQYQTDMNLSVDWAYGGKNIPKPNTKNVIRLKYIYRNGLEEIYSELKSSVDDRLTEETFIGTVENLSGEMGDNARRSGWVYFSLLIETECVKAKAYLNDDQYDTAMEQHKREPGYIKIKGILKPGRQPRLLEDIKEFEAVIVIKN